MRSQQKRDNGAPSFLWMLVRVPLLYWQFIRFQPSMLGTVIALIPVFLLIVAAVLLMT